MTEVLARDAFDAFRLAIETGESEDFAQRCAEDIRFFVPIPIEQWRGEQRGRQRVRELAAFERDEMGVRVTLQLRAVLPGTGSVAVEYTTDGVNKGGPYANHNAIVFDFADDLVTEFREYTGDVDPAAVTAVNK